ncbi:hypothetical protein [Pseudonocardia alni]|uniref:hypothetical protein n=1 Tax=Pseudonocardia alni TaxID=33907 RepID=UPI00280BA052|nr:hypothetical protein [Pseudonocardia alni]
MSAAELEVQFHEAGGGQPDRLGVDRSVVCVGTAVLAAVVEQVAGDDRRSGEAVPGVRAGDEDARGVGHGDGVEAVGRGVGVVGVDDGLDGGRWGVGADDDGGEAEPVRGEGATEFLRQAGRDQQGSLGLGLRAVEPALDRDVVGGAADAATCGEVTDPAGEPVVGHLGFGHRATERDVRRRSAHPYHRPEGLLAPRVHPLCTDAPPEHTVGRGTDIVC